MKCAGPPSDHNGPVSRDGGDGVINWAEIDREAEVGPKIAYRIGEFTGCFESRDGKGTSWA